MMHDAVFQGLVVVLVYGILFYPFFACLTTNYKLLGSFLGFFYAAIRLDDEYSELTIQGQFSNYVLTNQLGNLMEYIYLTNRVAAL